MLCLFFTFVSQLGGKIRICVDAFKIMVVFPLEMGIKILQTCLPKETYVTHTGDQTSLREKKIVSKSFIW